MENRQQQILSEIKALATLVRSQMEDLESKIIEFQQVIEGEGVEVDVMDMELSSETEFYSEPVVVTPEMEPEPELQQEPDFEPEPEPVPMAFSAEDAAVVEDLMAASDETSAETVFEVASTVVPESVDDDLPFFENLSPDPVDIPVVEERVFESEPVVPETASAILNDVQATSDVPVIDAMLDKHAWRTDMPGTAVKDIRSAISLNDRILFINFLFNEDPMSFQEILTKLNSMTSFDEAATYMMAAFPNWNWESDTVYRFMMALRRRLQ